MEASHAVAALSAIAQDTRLAAFRLLVQAGPDGLPASRIGDRLDLPLPTLSFHLGQLRQAGLVSSRRQGRSIIYTANYATMNELVGYLSENCCRGAAPAGSGSSVAAPQPAAQETQQ